MALSKNGKRIGMARHNEKIEIRDYIEQKQQELALDLGDAMQELKALDSNWEPWFDATIPDEYNYVAILPVVQARIEQLKQDAELQADADWLGDCILLSDDSDLGESPTEIRNSIDF